MKRTSQSGGNGASRDEQEANQPGAAAESESGGEGEGESDEPGLEVEVELEPAAGPSVAELQARLAELEAKSKDSYDKYVRSVAELDNVRKRTRKEVDEARADAQGRVIREVLPILDNLERAVAHASAGDDGGAGVIEGVRLVLRQFLQALERVGVTAVPAGKGSPFDPNEHEAVSQAESADQAPGTIVEVLQGGYRLRDRLLRPALVVVAKAPSGPPRPGNGGEEPAGPNGHDPGA